MVRERFSADPSADPSTETMSVVEITFLSPVSNRRTVMDIVAAALKLSLSSKTTKKNVASECVTYTKL